MTEYMDPRWQPSTVVSTRSLRLAKHEELIYRHIPMQNV